MSNRLFIGLLAAGIALSLSEACNHGATNGSTGTAGAGASTGTGNGSGQAGSGSGSAGTSGRGNTSGSAGSNGDTGTAGSSTSGTGNTSGSAGTVGTTGSGGSGSSLEMIDNLEDNDRQIIAANGRQGPWHSFNDSNGGNIQPPLGTGFVATSGGANNTAYAVHATGSGYQF